WLFTPPVGAASSLNWWAIWIWETADETFEMALEGYRRQALPYTTQFHDANEPVLLLSSDQTAQREGQWIKICSSSPNATPISEVPFQHQIVDPAWQIASADPP